MQSPPSRDGSHRSSARGRARAAATALLVLVTGTPALATPLDVVVRAAIAEYPTIRAAQANLDVAQSRVEEASAQHLPTFNVGAASAVSGAAVSQPLPRARLNLWSFGAIESGVDRERQRVAATQSRQEVTRDDVAFAALQSYLRTLRAWRLVGVVEVNLARHRRLAEDFEQIVRVDVGRRYDLVQAQSRIELVRGTLEDRMAELGLARQVLARYYRQPVTPAELELPAVADLPADPPLAIGAQDHPAVAAARRDVDVAEANARTLRLQRGPRLDLEAQGGRDPFSQVVLSWPAFDATLTAAERGAVAARLGAEATLQDVELTIAEQRRQADQDLASATRRLAASRDQVRLATELVNVYYEQFRVGRRNLLDLLTAYAELSNGEATMVAADVDRALARYRIAYASGALAPAFDARFAGVPPLPEPRLAAVPPFARGAAPTR